MKNKSHKKGWWNPFKRKSAPKKKRSWSFPWSKKVAPKP
jgi:hypothetical protein